MLPNVPAVASTARTSPVASRLARLALAALAALLSSQYLAGFFFLWSIHADPRGASLLTIARYAYYYGERREVGRRLWGSSGLALALVLASGVVVLEVQAPSTASSQSVLMAPIRTGSGS